MRAPFVMVLAVTCVSTACREQPTPPTVPPPTYETRFTVANDGEQLISIGYYVILDDTLADTTLRHAGRFAQPLATASERSLPGPRCHLGCLVDMRVDLFGQRRSFRLPTQRIETPRDTLFQFRWPGDTTIATEVPYAGDDPYCLSGPTC